MTMLYLALLLSYFLGVVTGGFITQALRRLRRAFFPSRRDRWRGYFEN